MSDTNNIDKTYVFEENNMVKGFMTTGDSRDDDKNKDTFELYGIYIDPLFQRQKIGSKFVQECIKEAKNMDKKEITLWVFEKNTETIQFYKKMGFEFDGKIKYMEGLKENAIRFKMEI